MKSYIDILKSLLYNIKKFLSIKKDKINITFNYEYIKEIIYSSK